jgi:hypothetical protein
MYAGPGKFVVDDKDIVGFVEGKVPTVNDLSRQPPVTVVFDGYPVDGLIQMAVRNPRPGIPVDPKQLPRNKSVLLGAVDFYGVVRGCPAQLVAHQGVGGIHICPRIDDDFMVANHKDER